MKLHWMMLLVGATAVAVAASTAPSLAVVTLVIGLAGYLAVLLGRDPDPR